ncbi:thiamine-phosphate kinase [Acidipropionibacterium virtanenii]|uniref:Thiamine-monophosphate kinase n=1 Tax=Acidipropionibacterium virtanenii TaxID=2057246 RepID=A0A344UTK3_9ACTN|nr:thiamine-phosphate kinase [Acidipropionibacterium virtanenii]AXE38601.1 Thiamine-monophosphate kinase [Acidipropionibacterium virtanenii]
MAKNGPTIAEIGEFPLIRSLVRDLPSDPAVSLGPGDDGAVFLVDGSAVISTDVLVEGVHFRRSWSGAQDIGRKSVAVNVADIEAMGAAPVAMVIGFSAPADLPVSWAREFMTGLREEAARARVAIVGGDTTAGPVVTVSVTVIGQTAGIAPVRRDGAAPADIVAIKGRLGWAAAGLVVLGRGFRSPRVVVEAQRCPEVAYGAGRQAALAGAHAMIDVSDGLVADLGHIAEASGVAIDIDQARLDIPDPLRTVGMATGLDPITWVLGGGEDHALAATFAVGEVPDDWQVIGRVLDSTEQTEPTVLVDGRPWEHAGGWTHF